VVKEIHEKV
jgi:hypothetical protein